MAKKHSLLVKFFQNRKKKEKKNQRTEELKEK